MGPHLTSLLRTTKPGGGKIRFYIYMPDELSEVDRVTIERTLAKIREKNYSTEVVRMEFEEGRARDVMTVLKEPVGDLKHFDLPNTLLTLTKMIDYQVESKYGGSEEREKAALKADLGRRTSGISRERSRSCSTKSGSPNTWPTRTRT